MSNNYRRFIIESKAIFYLFLIWAVLTRIFSLYQKEILKFEIKELPSSYIWSWFEGYFTNNYINFTLSLLMLIIVAIFINMSNVSSNFIKLRTYMPPMFVFLFLSSQQLYFYFTPLIIGAAIWGYIIFLLFKNYASEKKAEFGAQIGFYLALSSLFDPIYIIYLPVLWLGMHQMREINFKGWLACFFGLSLWYIPLMTFDFFVGRSTYILSDFSRYLVGNLYKMPIISFNNYQYILFGVVAIIQIILTIENTINRFGEKIHVCRSINMLIILELFSMALMVFLPNSFFQAITILLICYSLHISQFLSAMTNKNLMIRLFVLLSLIFWVFSIYSLKL